MNDYHYCGHYEAIAISSLLVHKCALLTLITHSISFKEIFNSLKEAKENFSFN